MESVFLSYTYNPHPDDKAHLERLRTCVVRGIEAMGLLIVDGVNVGGGPLDEALRKRIRETDALVALVTPQKKDNGNEPVAPLYVLSEFQYANGQEKPTMRIWHERVPMNGYGIGNGNEYTPYSPGNEVDVVLKLINAIALWKRENGRRTRVRIEPASLALEYDEQRGDTCEFQRISPNGDYDDFKPARLWQDPGAAYVLLPMLREGDMVRLCLHLKGKTWQSRHAINPFVGGVNLVEQGP
jgi:hypothetical protein